jgi:hypothetical protein
MNGCLNQRHTETLCPEIAMNEDERACPVPNQEAMTDTLRDCSLRERTR